MERQQHAPSAVSARRLRVPARSTSQWSAPDERLQHATDGLVYTRSDAASRPSNWTITKPVDSSTSSSPAIARQKISKACLPAIIDRPGLGILDGVGPCASHHLTRRPSGFAFAFCTAREKCEMHVPSSHLLIQSCRMLCASNVYPEFPNAPAKLHNGMTTLPCFPRTCPFTDQVHSNVYIKLSPPLPQLGVEEGFCCAGFWGCVVLDAMLFMLMLLLALAPKLGGGAMLKVFPPLGGGGMLKELFEIGGGAMLKVE